MPKILNSHPREENKSHSKLLAFSQELPFPQTVILNT